MKNFSFLTPFATNLVGIAILIFSIGISWQTFKSEKLSVKVADFHLDSTVQLSKNLALSKELEQKTLLLKQKEYAYEKLLNKYQELKDYNQPVEFLENEIEEIEQLENKINLEDISASLEETSTEIEAEISKISDSSTKELK